MDLLSFIISLFLALFDKARTRTDKKFTPSRVWPMMLHFSLIALIILVIISFIHPEIWNFIIVYPLGILQCIIITSNRCLPFFFDTQNKSHKGALMTPICRRYALTLSMWSVDNIYMSRCLQLNKVPFWPSKIVILNVKWRRFLSDTWRWRGRRSLWRSGICGPLAGDRGQRYPATPDNPQNPTPGNSQRYRNLAIFRPRIEGHNVLSVSLTAAADAWIWLHKGAAIAPLCRLSLPLVHA